MAQCGIPRIDGLISGAANVAAIAPGDADEAAVAAVQDLLTGLGQKPAMPGLLSADYGIFGSRTAAAVRAFRKQLNLPAQDNVDSQTLLGLVRAPATTPIASRAYLSLVLDFPFTGLVKVLSVTAQMEGAGKFGALNLNSDGAGLSFGLIQWAQKPGRLADILGEFFAASEDDFARILGAGDPALAAKLLAHAKKPNGGVDPATGRTVDPAFDLVAEPWVGRFAQAALNRDLQQAQVRSGLRTFTKSLAAMKRYAPQLQSERAVAFMLDLANQFGDGGARSVYQAALRPDFPLGELLHAIAAESVERMPDRFKAGTQARRTQFLTTSFLSDVPFEPPAAAAAPR